MDFNGPTCCYFSFSKFYTFSKFALAWGYFPPRSFMVICNMFLFLNFSCHLSLAFV